MQTKYRTDNSEMFDNPVTRVTTEEVDHTYTIPGKVNKVTTIQHEEIEHVYAIPGKVNKVTAIQHVHACNYLDSCIQAYTS